MSTSRLEFDVAVVGAGPAGASAAHVLARNGRKVVLIEKATMPRYKTCGGGILYRAVRLLPDGMACPVERPCHRAEMNFLRSGLRFSTQRSEPVVSMTMRSEFDFALATAAKNSGAEFLNGVAVNNVQLSPASVELATSRGLIRAAFLIAADGANSATAKHCGWSEIPRSIPAVEWELHVSEADFARFKDTVRFDFEVIPHGYAWVFPKKNHLSVGVLSTHRGRVNLAGHLAKYLEDLKISSTHIEKHGWVIPVAPRKEGAVRGRVLLAGDAAGLVDPMTAEGISHAILSGRLAAQAILDGRSEPANVASAYQTALREEILSELKFARLCAWVLYERPLLARYVFRKYGRSIAELVTDIVMGRKRYRNAFLQKRAYLRLLGLAGSTRA